MVLGARPVPGWLRDFRGICFLLFEGEPSKEQRELCWYILNVTQDLRMDFHQFEWNQLLNSWGLPTEQDGISIANQLSKLTVRTSVGLGIHSRTRIEFQVREPLGLANSKRSTGELIKQVTKTVEALCQPTSSE